MEKTRKFEETMQELESIVRKLEEGDVPLEEALSYYQKGMELSKWCHDKLQHVEEEMTKVVTETNKEKNEE